jgi:hypothetical protein
LPPHPAAVPGTTSATWTQSGTTSGTLAVTDGTHVARLRLLGQYVTANFHVQSDGHGGTYVSDPPVASATDAQPIGLVNPHQA